MVLRNVVNLLIRVPLLLVVCLDTAGVLARPAGESSAARPADYIVGIRGNEEATKLLAATLGAQLVAADAIEFPNGNTFVRFGSELTGKNVRVLLPEALTADTLMESLIKVYVARHQRARSVTVQTPNVSKTIELSDASTGERVFLNLFKLMTVAGASHLQLGDGRSMRCKPSLPVVEDLAESLDRAWIYEGDHADLATELAAEMELPIAPTLTALEGQKGAMIFYLLSSAPPVNWNFFKALSEINWLSQQGILVSLISPYLPYARTDKIDQEGVAITGRLVADLIEAVGTDSIAFVRAHAPQSEGFFSIPTFHASGRETINSYLDLLKVDMVISPDNGASKATYSHAKDLGVPMAVLDKVRDPITGELRIKGISTEISIRGKRVALIDDETASGGTFAEGAEYLKKMGAAQVYGVVTALAGDAKKAIESPYLDSLTVSNSIPVPANMQEKVTVLSVAKEIARKLRQLRSLIKVRTRCYNSFK